MTGADPSLSVAERVDAACDRFESDWRAGRRPRVEDFLAAAPESDHEELRRALLAVVAELSRLSVPEGQASHAAVRSGDGPAADATVEHAAGSQESPAAVGRFAIRGVLGSGAFGKVYRAIDPHLGREVALKVPLEAAVRSEAERARFLREARAAATINHPNVCQIHEVGEHQGRPYIVMALVPGLSLADTLKARKEPLPAKQAALIVRKMALALAAAHDKGVVHRDLKPANVMFDRERKDVIVMDFGLARGPRLGDARGTESGVIMGTPAYMSPEQARGDAKGVGATGDVFSLGVILYELLAGARPFEGTATEVIGKILHVDPEPPSRRRADVDPRLEAVCLKAMAKDPAARFATMREFAAAIDAALRPPALDRPTAETYADPAQQTAAQPTGNNLAEFFAALSAERKQSQAETAAAVEAVVARHRTTRWTFVLAGLVLAGGLFALGAIVLFTRSDKVMVTIELTDVALSDKSLSFFLDNASISAEALGRPIELKPGEHVLIARRGEEVVKRRLITVMGGRSPVIRMRDIMPPPVDDDASRMQGQWRCVAEHSQRREWTADELRSDNKRMTIRGNRLTISRGPDNRPRAFDGLFRVNSLVQPKRFDWEGKAPDNSPFFMTGVYELTGDRLQLCYRKGKSGARAGWADLDQVDVVTVTFERITAMENGFVPPGPDDLDRLQGEWDVWAEEFKGAPTEDEEIRQMKKVIVFAGDRMTIHRNFKDGRRVKMEGTIRLDPGASPKTWDFDGVHYLGNPAAFHGLYELDGDSLRMVYNTGGGEGDPTRPTAFRTAPKTSTVIMYAKRRSP